MAKKSKILAYKHKESGLYLEATPLGDGEGELSLVVHLNPNSIFNEHWKLDEILETSGNGAPYKGKWVEFTTDDFEVETVEIKKVE